MIFEIDHITTYEYSKNVVLDPQIIQLQPKNDTNQVLKKFDIEIKPKPEGQSNSVDIDGNNTITAWFKGEINKLEITTSSIIETLNENPFEYIIIDSSFLSLPISYPEILGNQLSPYMKTKQAKSVMDLSGMILKDTSCHLTNFMNQLNNYIYKNFTQIKREQGLPWSSEKTLAEGKGSCRDLTTLFIDVCRSVGLACRYVSGYAYENSNSQNELHAWAEVYIPGGGWRGFDPTNGLSVAENHVSVASGSNYNLIAPVIGNFYGNNVVSELKYKIDISKIN